MKIVRHICKHHVVLDQPVYFVEDTIHIVQHIFVMGRACKEITTFLLSNPLSTCSSSSGLPPGKPTGFWEMYILFSITTLRTICFKLYSTNQNPGVFSEDNCHQSILLPEASRFCWSGLFTSQIIQRLL